MSMRYDNSKYEIVKTRSHDGVPTRIKQESHNNNLIPCCSFSQALLAVKGQAISEEGHLMSCDLLY